MSTFIGYEDDNVIIYVSPAAWVADVEVVVVNPGDTIEITNGSCDRLGGTDGFACDSNVIAQYGSNASFTIGDPQTNPLNEETEYMFSASYILNGEYYGFGFKFTTVTRGESGETPDGDLKEPPQITSLWCNEFPDTVDVVFYLDTLNSANNYTVSLYVYNSVYECVHSFSCGNDELKISGDGSAYYIEIDRTLLDYGRCSFTIQTTTDYSETVNSASTEIYLFFNFNRMYINTNNNCIFSYDEWNEYRKLLSRELSNRGYTYNYTSVSLCDSVTPDTFNEPINAYYNAFGTYYEGVEPITGFYFGDYSGDSTKISAREFIQRLASMLNSLF